MSGFLNDLHRGDDKAPLYEFAFRGLRCKEDAHSRRPYFRGTDQKVISQLSHGDTVVDHHSGIVLQPLPSYAVLLPFEEYARKLMASDEVEVFDGLVGDGDAYLINSPFATLTHYDRLTDAAFMFGCPKQYRQKPWWATHVFVTPYNVVSLDVRQRVRKAIMAQLGCGSEIIHHQTRIGYDLDADSLDTVELVMELEEEFDISIPDDSPEKFNKDTNAVTVLDVMVHIQRALDDADTPRLSGADAQQDFFSVEPQPRDKRR